MQVLYLYPCCTSCSQADPVIESTAGSIQYKYCTCIPAVLVVLTVFCTCIPAVLVAARLVQLLKKLQVPDRKVHPRQAGPCIEDSIKENLTNRRGYEKRTLQLPRKVQQFRSHIILRGKCNGKTCLKHWSAQVAAWVAGPVVTAPPTRLWVVFQGREPASQKLSFASV